MADFDAGSIEGRLDLDTDPFIDGLRKAKAEAQKFERERYTATVATHYETSGDKPEPLDGGDQSSTVDIGADTSDFDADAARVQAELTRLDHEKATPEVNLDTRKSVASAARLRDELGRFRSEINQDDSRFSTFMRNMDHRLDGVAGFYKANSTPGAPGTGHGLMALVGLAAALAPALGPATGAVALFGAASVAAFGGAAVSMGLYAAVAKGAFTTLTDAIKNGEMLTGVAGKAQRALMGLQKAWGDLHDAVDPGIFRMLIPVFGALSALLPKLVPLINSISVGLTGAFEPIAALLDSGKFQRFLDLLSDNALIDLPQVGSTIAHIFGGLIGIFTALNPIIQIMVTWFDKMSGVFDHWANTKAPGAVTDLFDTVQKYGPQTLEMFKALGEFVLGVGRAFAPLTGPALSFLTTLATGLAGLNLAPLTAGIGSVMTALEPFITVLGELINVILPPLGTLLSTIADAFIGPLGQSLEGQLNPALEAFASVLNTLAPVLGEVVATFADLINPTGVNIFVEAITGLQGPIETLIPPLGRLIMALESMVDIGLESLTPVIGPLAGALQVLADALVPVINVLSMILENEYVVDVILAIAAAVKLWAIAQAILDAALAANPIGLVVIAIAALVVGLIAAYQHSETFRNIVDALWAGLKGFYTFMFTQYVKVFHVLAAAVGFVIDHYKIFLAMLGPLGASIFVIIQVIKHWSTVWHAITKVVGFVRDHLRALLLILGPVGVGINVVIEIVKHWSTITRVVITAWQAVMNFFSAVPGKVKGWFSSAGSWLVSAGSAIIHGLWNGLNAYWRTVVGFYSTVGSKIKGWFAGAIGWLYSVGWNIIQGLWDGLSARFDSLYSWASGKIESLVGLFHKIPGVSSPAKRLIAVGNYMGLGLHLGLAQSFDRYVIPTAKNRMKKLMDALHGATTNVGIGGTIDISQTGTQAQIGALAASVAGLTGAHNRSATATLDTLASSLDALVKAVEAGNDDLLDTLTAAYEKAGNKQMTKLITTLRSNH